MFSISDNRKHIKNNDDEIVQELKNIHIKELIENETGQRFKNKKILCPFHNEKMASFVIYPATNSFNCFGCNVGGDVIRFIELYKGLEFKEAINYLAQKYNIEIRSYSKKELKQIREQREEKQIIKKIWLKALNHFTEQLRQEHIDFLTNKYGLAPATIKKAKIGYIKTGLVNYLRKKGFKDTDIYISGLATKDKTTGKIKDMFYDRLIIPYLKDGQPVYFTGRALKSDDTIKYLNLKHTSPEVINPLFLAQLEGNDILILVEGELDGLAGTELLNDCDVIALGKAGLSKTKKKDLFKILKRYDDVVIINDTEENEAGIKGSIQTAKAILKGTCVICRIGQLEQLEGQKSTDIADYNREDKNLYPVVEEAPEFIELLQEDELIETIEQYVKNLWEVTRLRELSTKVKIIIPFMKDLNRIDCNLFIGDIRRIVKNKTSYIDEDGNKKAGSKNALGSKQDFLTMINEEKQKGKDRSKFNPSKIGEQVIEEVENEGDKWALIPTGNLYYRYNGNKGVWEFERVTTHFKNKIRQVLRESNKEWETSFKIKEVLQAINQAIIGDRNNLERFDAGINPNLDLINLKNGMLDWRTGELKGHDPSYYSVFQINVNYNPKATCPNWKKALRDWIPDPETIKFLQEFAGYCLIPDTSYQKALILHGGGSNGKSTFLEILQELYGEENCEDKALYEINQRFGTASIKDKLVNICPDIDPAYMERTAKIKSIIAGEKVSAEYKGQDSFNFRPVVRLMFSANDIPRTRDKSDGWLRRIEIVDFPNQFKPTDENFEPDLKKKLINELDGIFNWALEGLRRLKDHERFTISDEIKKSKSKYQKENDTVQSFVEESCELDPVVKATTEYLFREYREYCEGCNYKPVNRNVFIRTLKKLGLRKTLTTFEVCLEHEKYKCSECYNPPTIKKRKRGFKGLKL